MNPWAVHTGKPGTHALLLRATAAAPFRNKGSKREGMPTEAFLPSGPNLPESPQSFELPGHLPGALVSRIQHEAAALLAGPHEPASSGRLQANELCAPARERPGHVTLGSTLSTTDCCA